jgi:very-short-patch-repair endonuclease
LRTDGVNAVGAGCHNFQLVGRAALNVELDGSQHGFPDQRKHDVEREKFLQSRGIKTLRFWNSHLRCNAQSIHDTIFNELQSRAPRPLPDYTRPVKFLRKN